jgi:hypothetical protein
MPILQARKRQFRPGKMLKATWDSFRSGLNSLLRDSELTKEQVKELYNLVLEGKGIITQRPGTGLFFTASDTGKVRGIFGSKIAGNVELLAITDEGILKKKDGVSNLAITGASWASGSKVRMTQLQDKVYLVQNDRPLTYYNGSGLLSYTTIPAPTNLRATNLSGVTGAYTWSWRVAAYTDVGRTLASDPVTLANLPEDLTRTAVRLNWTAPSGAAGLVKGYEIHGREMGAESRLAGIPSTSTEWIDDGAMSPSTIAQLPDFNETGGPQAKYIIKSVGKLILGNISGHNSRLMWSGADVNLGKFHWTKGGGYIDIDANDGTEITGIKEADENRIIVWKERTIHQVKLAYNASLGIVEAQVQKISDAIGCLSHDTVQEYENNTYFVGRAAGRGISFNSLGYQPNILANVLRTAEMSGVIRPSLESINKSRMDDMFALVYGAAYWWFVPEGGSSMKCWMYDYERQAFTGPHTFPGGPICGAIFYDENGQEHMLYGNGTSGKITEVSKGYSTDYGADIPWNFTSKKEDFRLPFKLKTLLRAFFHLADISGGSVTVQIVTEKEDGLSTVEEAFTISSPSKLAGWGSFPFGGGTRYGSTQQASKSSSNSAEFKRYLNLNTPSVASTQVRISGTSKAKIVSIELRAREEASDPPGWLEG